MSSGPPRVKQTNSPFGKPPQTKSHFGKAPAKLKVNAINNSYVDLGGSGNQSPSGWVTVKSSYDNRSKPTYSYTTNKPPKQYKIAPKNKKLPSNSSIKTIEVKNDEPNTFWHSNPKQDPSATVCAICTKKFQNSSIIVDGYKIHRGCFQCCKCKKTLNHQTPSSYTKLGGFTLHFRDTYICSNCKVQTKYGVYGECTACKKTLPSVYFEDSDGNKYHNECFNCLTCGKSLANFTDRYFSSVGKDRYCKRCRQKQAYPNKTK